MGTVIQAQDQSERPVPSAPVSFEQFLEWADEDTNAEWVDGQIVMTSPASPRHQLRAVFLSGVLDLYVSIRRLGVLLTGPALLYLPTRPSGREPDLMFLANDHLDRIGEIFSTGPADLVVEIMSPESRTCDQRDKFREYEAAGVPEYWLLDPDRRRAFFSQLGQDGRYVAHPIDAEGVYRSVVLPDFWSGSSGSGSARSRLF